MAQRVSSSIRSNLHHRLIGMLSRIPIFPHHCRCRTSSSGGTTTTTTIPPTTASPGLKSPGITTAKTPTKVLRIPSGVNLNLHQIDYAVRGPLVARAQLLSTQLFRNPEAYNFSHITWCNIGNPQSLGQLPITFGRQVLSCCIYPNLCSEDVMPQDVKTRARVLLQDIGGGGLGAYSETQGLLVVRENIERALKKRDGYDCDSEDVFLTNGASEGIATILWLLIRNSNDGIMIPRPQYPLYSATLCALGGKRIDYDLDEENRWGLDVGEMGNIIRKEKREGIHVRALCVINPGNPTGMLLGVENMKEIVRFCEKEGLVLLADEVYQENVYRDVKFTSFKKVVRDMASHVELFSFHSVSKGLFGECGLRGGYMECVNVDKDVIELIRKCLSVKLCPNLPGQIMVDIMMNPPVPDDESYPLYKKESDAIFSSLQRKAIKLADALNSFEGVSCNTPEGAMYLFPQLKLPKGAHDEAERRALSCVDQLYARELLEETGICVVPGSGFGQVEGTAHIRTTFLPPENEIDEVVMTMQEFHEGFLKRYST